MMGVDEPTAAEELARLREENEQLRAQLKAARLLIGQLQERIAELERCGKRQAAPFRREERKKIPPDEQRRPGRKPGHRGVYRRIPDEIDQEIEVPLACCPSCRGPVVDHRPLVQYIEELPPMRPVVTRLVTWEGKCPVCGDVRSVHPLQTSTAQGAASVHLGPRALALGTLLNKHLGLTFRSTCRVLRLMGLPLTAGGLSQAVCRAADHLEESYERLLEQLRSSRAVYADETSWWVGGAGWWLWTFTNPDVTVYRAEDSRGSQVVKETLGEGFEGVLVSDCLASYDPLDCRKQKCIAHHLRAIAEAQAQLAEGQVSRYLLAWKYLFREVLALYRARSSIAVEVFAAERSRIVAAAERLLEEPVERPQEAAIRNRLAKQQDHLLVCLEEPAAEPTNNRAERALRPAVIARKLSCGNKTRRGKHAWEVLASLAQTCAQTGQDFTEYLAPKLTLATQAR